jgi:hypothetical protein
MVLAEMTLFAGKDSAAWNLGQWGNVMFDECDADVASFCFCDRR